MNKLQTFNHSIFGELPVLVVDGKEYFGATDVAKSLEYKQPHTAVANHCDAEGVITYNVLTKGGSQQKRFISLGNVSRLIVAASKQSKNPEIQQKAKVYEKWIFDEVIPSVHKHGAYMTAETIDSIISDPDFGIQLLTTLKKEREEKERAIKTLEIQRPKVVFAEALEISKDAILVKELAGILKQKGVNIGQNRLFKWLRDRGYLCKKRGEMYNLPTQKSLDMGLFEIKKGVRTGSNGEMKQTRTTKVTGKGQVYFVNKILEEEGMLVR